MIELLAALLLLQDKADADRGRVATLFEQAFKAQGLPRKMDGKPFHVQGMIVEDKDLHAFAAKHAPGNGAVLAVSSTGLTWVLAGGKRGDDGVPVAFFGSREGILLVVGGMKKDNKESVEAMCAEGPAHANRGGAISIGDKSVTLVARGSKSKDVATGEAPAAEEEELAIKGIDTLAKALESLAGEWSRATKDQRVDLAGKLAAAHRPAAGVLACVDKEAKFLVMIGADGTESHPDGMGVEVSGKAGVTVILVPGRAKGEGKPGTAKGAGAFIVEPK